MGSNAFTCKLIHMIRPCHFIFLNFSFVINIFILVNHKSESGLQVFEAVIYRVDMETKS